MRYSLSPERYSRRVTSTVLAIDGLSSSSTGFAALAEQQLRRGRRQHVAQPEAHFGGAGRLARVAAVEDDVLHPVAAQALRALLAEHPGDGVGHVALAAPVGSDDRGDAAIEGQVGPVGEGLEARNFEL